MYVCRLSNPRPIRQETATTIVGMVVGMAVIRLLAALEPPAASPTSGPWAVLGAWGVFLALTAVHVVANVVAMRGLLLTSLNAPRLELLIER